MDKKNTYCIVSLESTLESFIYRLHPCCGVSSLTSHGLESQGKSAVSEILLQRKEVHYLLALWIVEHCLCLQNEAVWQVEITHSHTSLVGGKSQDCGLNLLMALVGISIARVHTTCNFKTSSLLIGKHPLSTNLEVVA